MNSITILAASLISLALHEACHALALRTVGAPIRIFQIGTPVIYRRGSFALGLIPFFGGVQGDLSGVSWIGQAWYFLAGPAGSVLIGIGSMMLGIWLKIYMVKMIGVVSLTFGIFNLTPIPPMDGFRLINLALQIPYPVQVAWAALGWMIVAVFEMMR